MISSAVTARPVASWSSGPRASCALMIQSAQDARGPEEHEHDLGRRWDGRLDRRGLGEAVEPLGELGVLAAPVAGGEAEVEIAERTGDRDRAQGRLALERLGLGLELVEHAV